MWTYSEIQEGRHVLQTRVGVLSLAAASSVGWAPVIGIVALPLFFVGGVLLALGRTSFGPAHSRNAMTALILLVLALAVIVCGSVVTAMSVLTGPSSQATALRTYYNGRAITLVVAEIIAGLAYVGFTHALQGPLGKGLLWAAFGANLLVNLALAGVMMAAPGGPASPDQVEALIDAYSLWSIVPYAMFSVAYLLAYRRVAQSTAATTSEGRPQGPPYSPINPPRSPPSP